jgi:hypothetical protein
MQILVKEKKVKIDKKDLDLFKQYTWCWHQGYLTTNVRVGSKYHTKRYHQLLLKPKNSLQVDHINGDRTDNRKINLRICTDAENRKNKTKITAKSGYKGVYNSYRKRPFAARITVNNKTIYLGIYKTALEAAKSYDLAAKCYFGRFAFTNF